MEYQETTIRVIFRHPVHFTEVIANDVAGTEAVLEGVLSLKLVELYGGGGTIIIQNVTVRTSPTVYMYEEESVSPAL